jgi:hypothetical protein
MDYEYTKDCVNPHSVMRGIIGYGCRYKYGNSGSIIYEVIGIEEYDNPYGYFTIISRFISSNGIEKETRSHSGQLQPMFERGRLIPVEKRGRPCRYIRPHTCL